MVSEATSSFSLHDRCYNLIGFDRPIFKEEGEIMQESERLVNEAIKPGKVDPIRRGVEIEGKRDSFRRFYNSMVSKCTRVNYDLRKDCGEHAKRKSLEFDVSMMSSRDIAYWKKWIERKMFKRGIIMKENRVDPIELPWKTKKDDEVAKEKMVVDGIKSALEARGD
jgi:hypothetical protein